MIDAGITDTIIADCRKSEVWKVGLPSVVQSEYCKYLHEQINLLLITFFYCAIELCLPVHFLTDNDSGPLYHQAPFIMLQNVRSHGRENNK